MPRIARALSLLATLALVALAPPGVAGAAPEDEAGARYRNENLGIALRGPKGWRMVADKGAVKEWTRLVTFYEPATNAEAVLTMRERAHVSLPQLFEEVRKEWAADKSFVVTSTRTLEPTNVDPVGSIVIEATQTVAPKAAAPRQPAKPPAEGERAPAAPPATPAPAAQTWNVMATYWLGAGYEYLLYSRAPAQVWARAKPGFDAVRSSFQLQSASAAPKGEGAYQDETRGFACRFPGGYGVRLPRSRDHVVEFEPVSAEQPALGIYHFRADHSVEDDAKRIVAFYVDEFGGEGEVGSVTVGGREATLVTAHAVVRGVERTYFLAVFKRGDGEFFRVRADVPRLQEAAGRAVFDAFLASFQLGATPR
jgi:hypothetical protein